MEVVVFARAVGCARLAALRVSSPSPPDRSPTLPASAAPPGTAGRGRNAGRGGQNLLVVRILFHYREKGSPAVFAGRLPTVQIRSGHVSHPTGDRSEATERKYSPLPADWAR